MIRKRHAGQALAESLVALLLLVPLVLALQAIAEVQAGALQTTQSSRLLALSALLVGRSLDANALVQRSPLLFSIAPQLGVWSANVPHSAEPNAASNATRAVSVALAPAELLSGTALVLERSGWVGAQAQLQLPIQPLLRDVSGMPLLTLHSRMTLLTEDYQAVGRAEVAQRIAALDAMKPLRLVERALQPLAPLLSLIDPPYRSLCAHTANPDILPADRLTIVAAPVPGGACR